MTKKCRICGEEKDISEFYPRKTGGTRGECKTCSRELKNANYLKRVGGELKVKHRKHDEIYKDGLKICNICHQAKPETEFKRKGEGYEIYCKECERLRGRRYYQENKEACLERSKRQLPRRRELYALNPEKYRFKQIKNRYGLSKERYEQMIKDQNNKCKICNQEFTSTPHVDHNHNTNQIRGLLCSSCNTAIGLLKENPTVFNNAVEYLKVA